MIIIFVIFGQNLIIYKINIFLFVIKFIKLLNK